MTTLFGETSAKDMVRPGFLGAVTKTFTFRFDSATPLRDALEEHGIPILDARQIKRMKNLKIHEGINKRANDMAYVMIRITAFTAAQLMRQRGSYEYVAVREWYRHKKVMAAQGWRLSMMRRAFFKTNVNFRVMITGAWWSRQYATLHDLVWNDKDAAAHISLELAGKIAGAIPTGTTVEYETLKIENQPYDPIVYVRLGGERYAILQWD